MNTRILFAVVGAAALAFAGYQAFLIARPKPAAPPLVAATPAPAPDPTTPFAKKADPPPSQLTIDVPGMDAPFDAAVARRITAEQVKARLDRGEKVVFVDTRADIPDVMIKGAVQVTDDKVEAWAKNVPKNAFLVFYCTCPNELTAANAVVALQRKGYRTAYALRDGLFAWQSFELPTQPPPRPDAAS